MVELAVCSRFLKFSMKPCEKTSGRVSTCTAAIPAVFQSHTGCLLARHRVWRSSLGRVTAWWKPKVNGTTAFYTCVF